MSKYILDFIVGLLFILLSLLMLATVVGLFYCIIKYTQIVIYVGSILIFIVFVTYMGHSLRKD